MLFEEATDIRFFVGRASNPAHQNPGLPISFNIKMHLVDELTRCLRRWASGWRSGILVGTVQPLRTVCPQHCQDEKAYHSGAGGGFFLRILT